MWDDPEGGDLDLADGVRRHSKKNSSILSCIGKKTREGCDRGSEVGTGQSGREGKGQFLQRNRRNLVEEGICEKDFVSTKCSWYT